jgi:hypothetical protein
MGINFHLPKINSREFRRPNFLDGGLAIKSNLMNGAQIPKTLLKIFDLATRSLTVFLRLPELSLGCIAITIGWKLPFKPDRKASAMKMYSSPK